MHKFHFISATILLGATIFVGCQTNSNKPDSVAKDFIMAIDSRDTATALALATPESAVGIRLIMSTLGSADQKTAKHVQIDKMTCNVKDTTAVCAYCCDANQREQVVNLVRKTDRWQVTLKKDVPNFVPETAETVKKDSVTTVKDSIN
jgi:hypothetical protein